MVVSMPNEKFYFESSLRDKLRTLFFKYVEVASPEISLKSFKNVDIKGKTLLVGVGKASISYCEKIQDKIKSQYEGIIISTKIKNVSENLNNFKIFFAGIQSQTRMELSFTIFD